jgi:hypothetical protein
MSATYAIGYTDLGGVADKKSVSAFEWLFSFVRALGLLMFFTQLNIQRVFIIACAMHVVEALYACTLAHALGCERVALALWAVQTAILGGPSLNLLLQRRSWQAAKALQVPTAQ